MEQQRVAASGPTTTGPKTDKIQLAWKTTTQIGAH